MLITCWSCKGGSGTTVVAAALALLLAADGGDTLLVDLGGDLPAALGLPEPAAGVADWARAAPQSGGDWARAAPQSGGDWARAAPQSGGDWALVGGAGALRGLEVDVGAGVRLLPRGSGALADGMGSALAGALAGGSRVVVDAGVVGIGGAGAGLALDLAAAATSSLLVLRPCFLGLRRAVAAPLRGSGVVLVDEPQRALSAGDVEAALGVPVVAVVPWDPALARRVDAGLLGSSLPKPVARALRGLVRSSGAEPRPLGGARRPRNRPEAVA